MKPGSLYNALKRMTEEGLVQIARTERDGNPPERTIFEITAAGRAELVTQRDAALADVRLHAGPGGPGAAVHPRPVPGCR